MSRTERRRATAAERKARQRWARGVLKFHQTAGGVFGGEIIRPADLVSTRLELAAPLLLGWYQQALTCPSGPLCLCCDAVLRPPAAPGAFLRVGGAVSPTWLGLVTGICKSCAARSDDELLRCGVEHLRKVWPDLRTVSFANLHSEGGAHDPRRL